MVCAGGWGRRRGARLTRSIRPPLLVDSRCRHPRESFTTLKWNSAIFGAAFYYRHCPKSVQNSDHYQYLNPKSLCSTCYVLQIYSSATFFAPFWRGSSSSVRTISTSTYHKYHYDGLDIPLSTPQQSLLSVERFVFPILVQTT